MEYPEKCSNCGAIVSSSECKLCHAAEKPDKFLSKTMSRSSKKHPDDIPKKHPLVAAIIGLVSILLIFSFLFGPAIHTAIEIRLFPHTPITTTGTHANPVRFGRAGLAENQNLRIAVEATVFEVIRGEEARNLALGINNSLTLPNSDSEYIFARIHVRPVDLRRTALGPFRFTNADGNQYRSYSYSHHPPTSMRAQTYYNTPSEIMLASVVPIGEEIFIVYNSQDLVLWLATK